MHCSELDSLKALVVVDGVVNESLKVIIVALEELDYFDLRHFFHFDVIEVISCSLHFHVGKTPSALGPQKALEDHNVEFSISCS